jgi:nucleoid-associated protein YgaU
VRTRPTVIGVLAAELAAGALAAAPPAAADDEPEPPLPDVTLPVRDGRVDVDIPLPDAGHPVDVRVSVRTGRADDAPVDPPPPAPEPAPSPAAPDPPAPRVPAPGAPLPVTEPADAAVPPAAAPAAAPAPAAAAPPSTHTVAAGDSLWEIAARHLATTTGRDRRALGAPEVAAYWVRVCDAHRTRVASGDLDLIYPGEVVDLPPL